MYHSEISKPRWQVKLTADRNKMCPSIDLEPPRIMSMQYTPGVRSTQADIDHQDSVGYHEHRGRRVLVH